MLTWHYRPTHECVISPEQEWANGSYTIRGSSSESCPLRLLDGWMRGTRVGNVCLSYDHCSVNYHKLKRRSRVVRGQNINLCAWKAIYILSGLSNLRDLLCWIGSCVDIFIKPLTNDLVVVESLYYFVIGLVMRALRYNKCDKFI